jgi:hypothetical protein
LIDLFTGETWKQFRDAGSRISGFSMNSKSTAAKVKPGDVFLCYLTGVMRWVGALGVTAASKNTDPIWGKGLFPIRLEVEPIIELEPEYGIPMAEFEGKVAFYQGAKDRGKFKGIVRKSLNPSAGSRTDGKSGRRWSPFLTASFSCYGEVLLNAFVGRRHYGSGGRIEVLSQ